MSLRRSTLFRAVVVATTATALGFVPAAPAQAVQPAPQVAPVPEFGAGRTNLDALTIPDLQRGYDKGSLSPIRITLAYLERIRTVDRKLHAVLKLDNTALLQALKSEIRHRKGRSLGPLDGVPVLLKDNIDTKKLATTAGSRALLGKAPTSDATLVKRLKAAGAIILGKANLSEWANFRANNATSGWSGVGGQTNNPYVLDRNPCGSSSGSAVGVAASLAQVAIGTETNGSIVCPSGQNGVVGLKPTLGLVSRTGVVPITAEQDTAGPIGRHVVDVAITLSALQGKDRKDAATGEIPANQTTDYAKALKGATLKGKRIGVWRQAGIDPGVDAVVNKAVATIKANGGTVVEVTVDAGDSGNLSFTAMKSEFVRDLEAYLATRPGQEKTLAQLVAFNERDPIELSLMDQGLFEECLTVPDADHPTIVAARAQANSLARNAIDSLLKGRKLDAIISPTNSTAWKTTYGNGDDFLLGSSGAAAVAGYPNLSVPAGFSGELPIGISFIGGRWQDAKILALGAAFEKAADARKAPKYLPSVG